MPRPRPAHRSAGPHAEGLSQPAVQSSSTERGCAWTARWPAPPVGSHGGALAGAAAATVADSTFDANVANRRGFSAAASSGGGISTGAALHLSHDTFTTNVGENGGAVHAGGALSVHADTFIG